MIRRVIVVLIVVASVLVPGWYERSDAMEDRDCTEDMACWDCQTQGNHYCGGPKAITAEPTYTG